jgi:hypothetical protein
MPIRVGDIVRFKATGVVCVYLGMVDGCYTFHNNEHGRVQLSETSFNNHYPENLEVLS